MFSLSSDTNISRRDHREQKEYERTEIRQIRNEQNKTKHVNWVETNSQDDIMNIID